MISAGNDIVALNVIDSRRTHLPAFYSKFITPPELALYRPADISFENFVWLLWSVKESAYKYLKRLDAALLFSPSKIIIERVQITAAADNINLDTNILVDTWYTGEVRFNDILLDYRSIANQEFISSIIINNNGAVYWGVRSVSATDNATQSAAVREFVINKLQQLFPNDELQLTKSEIGYPVLIINNYSVDLPISFAHHDRYVSYSFQFPYKN